MTNSTPRVLDLTSLGDGRFDAPHPEEDPEGRNVVFSGQIMAQMIMAADQSIEHDQDVKAIHAVFSRAGTYDSPMTLAVETTHSGRLFGSVTVTAHQGDRLLSRGMVLLNAYEDDFISHGPNPPQAPGPDGLEPDAAPLGFPGIETRTVRDEGETAPDGAPSLTYWVRAPQRYDSVAANQAALAWSQPGSLIGLALRPHRDAVTIEDAHVSVSTGVIAHTIHFHERFDAAEWLLVQQSATFVGHGRVFGSGRVYDRGGKLVSSFTQESMVRRADRPLDPKRSM